GTSQPGTDDDYCTGKLPVTLDLKAVQGCRAALEAGRKLLPIETIVCPGSDGGRRWTKPVGRSQSKLGQRQTAAIAQGAQRIALSAEGRGRLGHGLWVPKRGMRWGHDPAQSRTCPCRLGAHRNTSRPSPPCRPPTAPTP